MDIVLPCYNPPQDWHKALVGFHRKLMPDVNAYFIIVNDGSTNGEFEKALPILEEQKIAFRVISYTINKGKGFALRKGVENSANPFVVYTDVDFPFTNESTLKMIQMICSGNYDVLAGSRDQAYYRNKMSGFRKMLSRAFRFFLRHILKMEITDTQCGLKAFNEKGKAEFLKTSINRYLFDFEFIYRCSKIKELKVHPVPVLLKPDVIFSKMKLKVILQECGNLLSVILFRKA